MKTQHKTTLGLLAGAACLLSAHTFAAPITEFNFNVGGGFVNGSGTCNPGVDPCGITYSGSDAITGDPLRVTWGDPVDGTNTSFLEVEHNPLSHASITTNGGWFVIDAFHHSNFTLWATGGWLNFVQVAAMFELLTPTNDLVFATAGINNVNFHETLNSEPCDDPRPGGNITICDDVLQTEVLEVNIPLLIGDYMYSLSFGYQAGPGTFVEDQGDGTVKIWTGEEQVSTLYTVARIDVRPVPEPGTLALFGLSLLGMGAYARRRKQH